MASLPPAQIDWMAILIFAGWTAMGVGAFTYLLW